jgi:predicted ATPase with chaperone activity
LLLGSGQFPCDTPGSFAVVGKLVPMGKTSPIKGALVMALQSVAEKLGGPAVVPTASEQAAAVVEVLNVYPISSGPPDPPSGT